MVRPVYERAVLVDGDWVPDSDCIVFLSFGLAVGEAVDGRIGVCVGV